MSLPEEKLNALVCARSFLRDLLDPKKTPRVPRAVRQRAAAYLKHYPAEFELKKIHKRWING